MGVCPQKPEPGLARGPGGKLGRGGADACWGSGTPKAGWQQEAEEWQRLGPWGESDISFGPILASSKGHLRHSPASDGRAGVAFFRMLAGNIRHAEKTCPLFEGWEVFFGRQLGARRGIIPWTACLGVHVAAEPRSPPLSPEETPLEDALDAPSCMRADSCLLLTPQGGDPGGELWAGPQVPLAILCCLGEPPSPPPKVSWRPRSH